MNGEVGGECGAETTCILANTTEESIRPGTQTGKQQRGLRGHEWGRKQESVSNVRSKPYVRRMREAQIQERSNSGVCMIRCRR